MIENDVFGFTFHRLLNKQMSINIDKDLNYKSKFSSKVAIYAEIGIETVLIILSYLAEKSINDKESEDLNETINVEEEQRFNKIEVKIDSEAKVEAFYEAYQKFKIEKTLIKCLFFFTLICIVATNISLSNTINLILLLGFILICLFQSSHNDYLELLSKVFCFFSFLLLISQYVLNIRMIKNKRINAYLGIIDFNNNLGTYHFVSLAIGYMLSCLMNKYDYNMIEYKEKCRNFLISVNVEFKSIKEVRILIKVEEAQHFNKIIKITNRPPFLPFLILL